MFYVSGVEVKTVDGFQGREKEAVVISLVRSNEKGIIKQVFILLHAAFICRLVGSPQEV